MFPKALGKSVLGVLLAATALGCGEQTATLLHVNVQARHGVGAAQALTVGFRQSGETVEPRLLSGPGGGAISWPTDFVLRADGRSGSGELTIKALDAADITTGKTVGLYSGKVTLTADRRTDITAVLQPADAVVAKPATPATAFAGGSWGGQVASDGEGNFVVAWENEATASGATQHDILFHLFNNQGQVSFKGFFGLSSEHQPSVAMQRQGAAKGYFVVVWVKGPAQSGQGDIYRISFGPKGTADTAPNADKAQKLSSSSTATASRPHIAQLPGGGYVVVWQEETASGVSVMGRLLDDHGRAVPSPGGQNEPFSVAAFSKSTSYQPDPSVAGSDNGFLVAWSSSGKVRGQLYSKSSSGYTLAGSAMDLAKTSSGQAIQPVVAALLYGYVVLWSDISSFAPDKDGQCIRMRRFSFTGAALEEDFTLNTTVAGDQTQPVIARRSSDGSLLAVWSSAADTAQDPKGGLRARLVLHNGLPVGDDFGLNTDTEGKQQWPSVAAHMSDGYATVFGDGDTGPGRSLKLRLYYPGYRAQDGKLGALCDAANPCGSNLYCVGSEAGKRCMASCKGSGASCLLGGTCMELNGNAGTYYCAFLTQ